MNQITTALTPAQIAEAEGKRTAQAAPQVETKAAPAPQRATVEFAAGDGRTKTVKLEWPITIDGNQVDTITLRRLTGRDYKALATLPAGADENAALLAIITGLPAVVVESLDAEDYEEVAAAAKDFLPRSLLAAIEQASATGAPSQP